MVANLSASKKGWEDRWEEFSKWAEKGQAYKKQLLDLVDEDTRSFNAIMNGFALPKGTDEEKAIRKQVIQDATKYAIEVPLKVMEVSLATMEVMKAMVEIGNPNSITDAGVGALCARTAVMGAHMNVKINTGSYDDKTFVADILKKAAAIEEQAVKLEGEIVGLVNKAIG
jgi:glutamate formiminotransferase/formiminotetrahydrofolate cyclodeaminase